MFEPLLKQNNARRYVSKVINFSAPVGGWAADNTFNADGTITARILRNMAPRQNTCKARKGSRRVAAVTGAGNSLMSYESGTTRHLLCAALNKVYKVNFDYDPDVDLVPPTELGTGFTNPNWQYIAFANAADEVRLVCVNGSDGMHLYDGAAFTRHIVAAGDRLTLSNVTSHKGRLWFTDLNSSVCYYADPLSNEPASLTPFPVGPFLRKGSSIICIDSMSVDGGSGPDDYLIMISDRGELLVWKGIDPADDYSLVGVFAESKPLGYRSLGKLGSDLVYFSHSGPDYVTRLLPAATGLTSNLANPIKSEFETAIQNQWNAFGWEFVHYSRAGWVMFNIPILPPNLMRQYCFNIETEAWFEITGWNALTWCAHDNNLFFSTATGDIIQADFGDNDNGNAIEVDYMQSWFEFQTSSKKKFNMAQVTIKSNVKPDFAVDIMVDYEEVLPQSTPAFAQKSLESPWDISPWNTSPWSGSEVFYVSQFGLMDIGYVGALRYRISINGSSHELYGFRIAFEEGEFA